MPDQMQQRALAPAQVRFAVNEAEGTFTGYAAVFGDLVPSYNERVMPGAFARTIAERAADGRPLAILWGHDTLDVIGIATSLAEDSYGLKIEGRLVLDIQRAKDARTLIQQGIQSLSIGFWPTKWSRNDAGETLLEDVDLFEISVVYAGASPRAQITDIRQIGDNPMPQTTPTPATPATPDLSAIESRMAEMQTRIDEMQTRAEEAEVRAQRPGSPAVHTGGSDETRALNTFLRGGIGGLDEIQRRALNLGTPSAGGYAVAPEYSRVILNNLTEFSPIRALASVLAIGTTEVYIPTLATALNGGWVTETGERGESQPVFGQVNIPTFEFATIVPVSLQLLEDNQVDLAGFLTRHIGSQFGKAEATAFVTGDGNGKPTGLLSTPGNYEQVAAAQDGSDIIAKIIELHYALPGAYAARASWLMNRRTQGIIRAAADNATKGTLWSDSLANGTPPMLLGRPVYDAPDMDDLADGASPTEDTYPIAFADVASSYQVVDRVGVAIMRDDYTGADTGIVKLRARRRVGGKPTLTESMVLLRGDI